MVAWGLIPPITPIRFMAPNLSRAIPTELRDWRAAGGSPRRRQVAGLGAQAGGRRASARRSPGRRAPGQAEGVAPWARAARLSGATTDDIRPRVIDAAAALTMAPPSRIVVPHGAQAHA